MWSKAEAKKMVKFEALIDAGSAEMMTSKDRFHYDRLNAKKTEHDAKLAAATAKLADAIARQEKFGSLVERIVEGRDNRNRRISDNQRERTKSGSMIKNIFFNLKGIRKKEHRLVDDIAIEARYRNDLGRLLAYAVFEGKPEGYSMGPADVKHFAQLVQADWEPVM